MTADHTGTTVRIRHLLEAEGRSLTIPVIAARLDLDVYQVRAAINTMISRTGGVVQTGAYGRSRLYGIAGTATACKPRGSGNITPPPYRTGYRGWGGGRAL